MPTQKTEYEMPDEYKRQLAQLAHLIDERERFTRQLKGAPAELLKQANPQLRKMDKVIDNVERALAEEYERFQAEMRKEDEIAEKADEAWVSTQHIYIMTKHKLPHLLKSFTERVLDPLPEDLRQEFLSDVAYLESTKLDAILKGEK